MKAYLALEDGTVFTGESFGATGHRFGEVVFNTSMTGYQEILTDPSYCGQIVTMTYPLIGNYGVNKDDFESRGPSVRGFVVKELCSRPSNWRSAEDLETFLDKHGIIGIQGIDTRALTRRLRNHGTMRGIIATGEVDPRELIAEARRAPQLSGQQLVPVVTTKQIYTIQADSSILRSDEEFYGSGTGLPELRSKVNYRVVLVDFGAKHNIIRWLHRIGCQVTVVPAQTTAAEILALQPQGLMLSNGPGDPKDVPDAITAIRELLGQIPIFGICLGHQILGLALGGDTYKLKFGHRGANHPVKDLVSGRVHITSQNHGYAIDANSFNDPEVVITHRNLNDDTVEGLRHWRLSAFSVQYHPESSPGPTDSEYLFYDFFNLIEGFWQGKAS